IPGKLPLLSTQAPASIVLIVDNSASMGITDAQGERFRRLQQYAERLLRSLGHEDEVALLPTVTPAQWQMAEWGNARGALIEALNTLSPRPEAGDLSAALQRAEELLRTARHLQRFVVILSDFQRNLFAEQSSTRRLLEVGITVYAVNVAAEEELGQGLVVDSVSLETQLRAVGEPVAITARVSNVGTQSASGLVSLFWNGERVAQRRVVLQPGQSQTVVLTGTPTAPGFVHAAVVAEGDVVSIGERRFVGFVVPEPIRVGLLADGPASTFLEAALSAYPAQSSPLRLETLSAAELASSDLTRFRVLVIASTALTPVHLSRLEAFIRGGGGVVLFAADGGWMQAVAPWLAQQGMIRIARRDFSPAQPATIVWADKHHPFFSGVFTGETRGELLPETPKLNRLVSTDGGIPLLRSSAGTILAEQRLGKGRLIFCGIAPDLEWGDFPRSGLFPTVVVRSVLLAGSTAVPAFFREAGESVTLTLPATQGTIALQEPSGTRRLLSPLQLSTGTRLELGVLREPGVYDLTTDATPLTTVTVNIPTAELRLEYATPEQIQSWFERLLSPGVSFRYLSSADELLAAGIQGSDATELWRYFLVMALLLAVLELVLSYRLMRSNAVPEQ
ncbi:MAG: VWA domain-containing protein, partial [Chlorobiota bacterium]